MSDLATLEQWLVETRGRSRPLDGALYLVAHGKSWEYGDGELPHYTESIDAALALVERVLPGWSWSVEKFPHLRAQLAEPIETGFGKGIGIRSQVSGATTPSIAICLALVQALIAQKDTITEETP